MPNHDGRRGRFAEIGARFVRHCGEFIELHRRCCVVTAKGLDYPEGIARTSRYGLAGFTRLADHLSRIAERGLGVTKKPKDERSERKD